MTTTRRFRGSSVRPAIDAYWEDVTTIHNQMLQLMIEKRVVRNMGTAASRTRLGQINARIRQLQRELDRLSLNTPRMYG